MYIKQCVSADISKLGIDCRFGWLDDQHELQFGKKASFENNPKGIKEMFSWACKQRQMNVPCNFVMEATGVYHEALAHFLYDKGEKVFVLLPARVKKFTQSLQIKSKTDPIDAKAMCQMGLERKFDPWSPPKPIFKILKTLCHELDSANRFITRLKNQIHALESSFGPLKSTLKRYKSRLKAETESMKEIRKEIKNVLATDQELKEAVHRIAGIPGISWMTVVNIVAETNGFVMIKNAKQLASYSGLDIRENKSGAFTGKTRISKKGNRFIRKILFLPAMSATRFNPTIKALHRRIKEKTSLPMKGIIAGARKLLTLIFSLWKSGQHYIRPAELA